MDKNTANTAIADYYRVLKSPNVAVMCVTVFVIFASYLSWFFMLPFYLRRLGAGEGDITLTYVVLNFSFCLFQFVGGYFSDKFGRKPSIVIPTFFSPLFLIAAAYTQDWKTAMIIFGLGNMMSSFQMPAFYSMFAESVKEEDRGLVFGLFQISSAAAFAAGPGIGSLFTQSVGGVRKLLIMGAILTLLSAMIRQHFLVEPPHRIKQDLKPADVYNALDKNLILCFAGIVFFTFLINTTIFGPFIPLISGDVLKLQESEIQQMVMLGGIFAIAFNFLGGIITKKIGSRKSFIFGALGHAFILLPWFIVHGYYASISFYVVSYLFLQLGFIGHDTIITDLTKSETRASVIGIFGFTAGIIGSFAPQAVHLAQDHLGAGASIYLCIFYALSLTIFISLIKSSRI